MIRRVLRVPLFRSGSQKPGLIDYEHPDLTNREAMDELQRRSLQGGSSISFALLSDPALSAH